MLKINSNRLLEDLRELAQIGRTPEGGVTRTALSAEDAAGRSWFQAKVQAGGLGYCIDGAGNQSACFPSRNPDARTVLAGSHLDTVPNGGQYDGALGVLAALEALRVARENDLDLPANLEAVNFTDEEGSLLSMIGSLGATGHLDAAELARGRGGASALDEGLARVGLTRMSAMSARRDMQKVLGYVELHIEQGKRLEGAGLQIGAVTSIVGIRSYWLTFFGRAAHAGTTPMAERADALAAAASFVVDAHDLVHHRFSPGVMNCGQIEVGPGVFNIVPATARLALEIRHSAEKTLDAMRMSLWSLAQQCALRWGASVGIEPLGVHAATQMDADVVRAIELTADDLGLKHTQLVSYAGHDAQNLARMTPSAMIFVPSVDGISHNPRELTQPEDVINGANVLLNTMLRLAARPG